MANIALLAVCLLMGILLRRTGRMPSSTPAALNGYVINVALPAAAIRYIHDLTLEPSLLLTGLMAWLLFGAGWLFFAAAARLLRLSAGATGALVLVGGLGNTSFVGLPMIEAWYGKELLGIGIIADQLGSFLVLSTLGVLAASIYSSGGVSARAMGRKVIMFPPFQALCLAFLLKPVPFHPMVVTVLQKLADTIAPVAIVSVGFQLIFGAAAAQAKPLLTGLAFKLLFGPALIALLYIGLFGGADQTMRVTLFEAAMPPMITAGIVAVDHGLEPDLVALMLGIGIPLSFLSLAGWWNILERF
ncbi:putative transporter [Geobacter sp. OR-1]|uniref:AEC family transporter n=1 Tax=Geobacter sp. OR-1 TaxID=1266765 RepID=UPI00054296C2|nr:AEC family transporter [Geobacter sp. OR-1]GAM09569.1 putative transporter [Geobacter sp. OR-1]